MYFSLLHSKFLAVHLFKVSALISIFNLEHGEIQLSFFGFLLLGLILLFLSVYVFIQLLKKNERELIITSSQNQLKSLINTIDGVVWEGNPHSDVCTFVSEKVYDVLGYTKKEWMETSNFWYNNLHPGDRKLVSENLNEAIQNQKTLDLEYRIIAKNKSIVWIRDIITVINEPNQPTKLRGIMIDITRKKADEFALKQSFDLLSDQNKRLLNFSYIVSHNLRSHAVNIQGVSSLIETAETDDERNEMLQLLKKLGNDLNQTLLNLSKIVNVQTNVDIVVQPLNLYDYIKKSLIVQNPQIIIKKAEITVDVEESIIVNYNASYLESILLYFIANALRCAHPDRKPIVNLKAFYENGQLVLSIKDNGIGIDLKKYKDSKFGSDPAFGENHTKGFGSFITKSQVESMGGKIEFTTQLEKGTTFKIYFK